MPGFPVHHQLQKIQSYKLDILSTYFSMLMLNLPINFIVLYKVEKIWVVSPVCCMSFIVKQLFRINGDFIFS